MVTTQFHHTKMWNILRPLLCSRSVLLCTAVLYCLATETHSVVVQDLGTANSHAWIGYCQNKSIRVNATVPGSIYSDLNTAGVLTGDLYDNFHDLDYRWVSYDNWTFELASFSVAPAVLAQQHVYLTAHGLDTIGNVTLNGHSVGTVEDMFVRYRWEVKSILKPTDNRLEVAFESAPLYGKQKHEETAVKGYPIPMLCRPSHERGECHANHIRKMQSSFGWDWGPAFPTQGIWRPLVLEAFTTVPVIRTISVDTIPKKDAIDSWTLNTTVFLEGVSATTQTNLELTFTLSGSTLAKKTIPSLTFDRSGEATVNFQLDVVSSVHKIERWWPAGMGTQSLYELKVSASVAGSPEESSKHIRIGFRTFELSQESIPVTTTGNHTANAFYFKINSLPFFSKGSNWIPANVLPERVTDDYLFTLLWSVRQANMNTLRVWGGGLFESDRFYEICDELGILVTQDFMFASSLYPGDDHFLALVSLELRQQIQRLQHHPSIVLWSGNNENEGNIARPYWKEIKDQWDRYKHDYLQLTINVTEGTVQHFDPNRPFVSSSPSPGVSDASKGHIATQDPRAGDMHYYAGGHEWNWHHYPRAKFVSEYGYQSLCSMHLLERHIDRQWLQYPITAGLDHRQHLTGSSRLLGMVKGQFYMPKSGQTAALADFVYLSQVAQAMSIKIETEFYRRDRLPLPNGEGMTMGALYWQLNDIWPGFSWSSLEYGGRWKVLHYYVRRFFDNFEVDIFEDGDQLKAVIVRDDHQTALLNFNLTLTVFEWNSTSSIHTEEVTVTGIKPFSVTTVYDHSMKDFLDRAKCPDRKHCFVEVTIEGHDAQAQPIQRSNFLLLSTVKEMIGLKKPVIGVQVIDGPVRSLSDDHRQHPWQYTITLHTDHVAPFVVLDLLVGSDVEGVFSDNGFMLTNTATVNFYTKQANLSAVQLSNLITVRSLMDVNMDKST